MQTPIHNRFLVTLAFFGIVTGIVVVAQRQFNVPFAAFFSTFASEQTAAQGQDPGFGAGECTVNSDCDDGSGTCAQYYHCHKPGTPTSWCHRGGTHTCPAPKPGPNPTNNPTPTPGPQPAWVTISVTAKIPNVAWMLICPGGPYSCNGASGVGTEAPMDPGKCQNGSCAGQGTYTVIPDAVPGYNCAGSSANRGARPPSVAPINLKVTCTAILPPTPTPTPPLTPTPTPTPTGTPTPTLSPGATPLPTLVGVNETDYCAAGIAAAVHWQFTDPDVGDVQTKYEVQIDDQPAFGSPEWDSGVVGGAAQSPSTGSCNAGNPPGTGPGTCRMTWDTVYYARVMLWDRMGAPSAWATLASCTGPPGNPSGCIGGTSWKTPTHAYPGSPVDFTWTPLSPTTSQTTDFSSPTVTCYDNGNNPVACPLYDWSFGGGIPPLTVSGYFPNPTHRFDAQGIFLVTLQVHDASGHHCPALAPVSHAVSVGVSPLLPQWKEVLPH